VPQPSPQVQPPRYLVPPRHLLILSLLLYGGSLLTNVFAGLLGAVALAFGWMEAIYFTHVVGFWVGFAWFANPLLFGAWILLATAGYRRALLLAVLALILGLGLLAGTRIVVSGSGMTMNLPQMSLGYWLWIASLAAALLGALLGVLGPRSLGSGILPGPPPEDAPR
jgi:hypothetical protein